MRFIAHSVSIIFDYITRLRNWLFDKNILNSYQYPIPIICVGNLSIGGSGKTPQVEYLINLLIKKYKTAVLSRGYGRRSQNFIYVKETAIAKNVGDEAVMIKQKYPEIIVAVEKNRNKGVKKLLIDHPNLDVILLDDGFQHRSIKSGMNILVTPFHKPFFNDQIWPLGTLRENTCGIKRADIIVISKCSEHIKSIELKNKIIAKLFPFSKKKIYFSMIKYNKWICLKTEKEIKNKPKNIILVTSIADTTLIINSLTKDRHNIKHLKYSDHHNYHLQDIEEILTEYNSDKNIKKAILTTEKDAVKLKEFKTHFKEIAIYVLPIKVIFETEKIFEKQIIEYVRKKQKNNTVLKN